MEIRAQRLPMPVNEARLQETILHLLRLPQLQELKVSLQGLEIRRVVEEHEVVIPETIVDVARGKTPVVPDLGLLLKTIEVEALQFSQERHQLTTLMQLTEKVLERDLHCVCWYVAEGDTLDAFLAQEPGTCPSALFTFPVYYVPAEQLPEGKLLLVGSRTRHLIDAQYGISADIGG